MEMQPFTHCLAVLGEHPRLQLSLLALSRVEIPFSLASPSIEGLRTWRTHQSP